MDGDGTCLPVSVFHLSEDAVARVTDRGDGVAIAEPVVRAVTLGATSYSCVQVLRADSLVVGGRALKSTAARPEMRVTAFDS